MPAGSWTQPIPKDYQPSYCYCLHPVVQSASKGQSGTPSCRSCGRKLPPSRRPLITDPIEPHDPLAAHQRAVYFLLAWTTVVSLAIGILIGVLIP